MNSSRILPIALSAVLVLGACGGDDATSDGTIDTVGEQPGLRAPAPIQIASGGSTGGGSLAAGAAAEDSAATSEMMIAPDYWISEYVVGDGFPALPTDDLGYVYDATGSVDAEQVAQLAAALGVSGEPVYLDEEWGSSWRVGPDDGSAATLWVNEDGMQSWNYNSAWQDREAVVGCAVAVDSDGNEIGECPEIEPPVGVPTQAEAEQRATDLLAALGEDPSVLEFDTHADDWYASVTVRDDAEDRASLREWNFGFGPDGVLEYASGWLAAAEPVGPYPLIDLDTAVARLNDGGYVFGGYGRGLTEPAIATAEAPPVDPAIDVGIPEEMPVDLPEGEVVEGSTGGSEGSAGAPGETDAVVDDDETVPAEPTEPMPVEDMPVEDMPVEPEPAPMPEPEPIVMTLVDVEADLWWAWDIDGSVWLLPAYRFIDAEGGWHTVPAVTDEFMIEVEPPVFIGEPEPMPAPEPMPVEVDPESVPGEPEPEPMPVEVDPETAPERDAPQPIDEEPGTPSGTVAPIDLDLFVGLPLDEFIGEVEPLGYTVRVAERDGEGLDLTADYVEFRLNVAVDGDVVTRIIGFG